MNKPNKITEIVDTARKVVSGREYYSTENVFEILDKALDSLKSAGKAELGIFSNSIDEIKVILSNSKNKLLLGNKDTALDGFKEYYLKKTKDAYIEHTKNSSFYNFFSYSGKDPYHCKSSKDLQPRIGNNIHPHSQEKTDAIFKDGEFAPSLKKLVIADCAASIVEKLIENNGVISDKTIKDIIQKINSGFSVKQSITSNMHDYQIKHYDIFSQGNAKNSNGETIVSEMVAERFTAALKELGRPLENYATVGHLFGR
jgi:hypothetical protein